MELTEVSIMNQRLVAVFAPFENLTDPRIERTLAHDLFDIVVVGLCATIAGADGWVDVERFGNRRLDWLKSFLRLENGIPSHDTFGRVFGMLNPAELTACIQAWLDEIGRDLGKHVAIDGKTLRGSFDKAAGKSPLHLVSAWASEARLALGQVAVDDKSNEITAIPLLLELLDLKGATVTIDAMGCQKDIAAKIVAKEAHYVLALKGNHEKLHEAVVAEFETAAAANFQRADIRRLVAVEKTHGREERREYTVMPAPKTLPGFAEWAGLVAIGMVLRIATVNGVETADIRYFLSSLPPKVKQFASAVRRHWNIESRLHWVLDVTFSEDKSRIRKRAAPQTAAMLRRMAVSILASDTSMKDSIRGKRYCACLSTDVLEQFLLNFARK